MRSRVAQFMVDNPGRYFDAFDEGSGGGVDGKGLEVEIENIQRAGYWYLRTTTTNTTTNAHQTTGPVQPPPPLLQPVMPLRD